MAAAIDAAAAAPGGRYWWWWLGAIRPFCTELDARRGASTGGAREAGAGPGGNVAVVCAMMMAHSWSSSCAGRSLSPPGPLRWPPESALSAEQKSRARATRDVSARLPPRSRCCQRARAARRPRKRHAELGYRGPCICDGRRLLSQLHTYAPAPAPGPNQESSSTEALHARRRGTRTGREAHHARRGEGAAPEQHQQAALAAIASTGRGPEEKAGLRKLCGV